MKTKFFVKTAIVAMAAFGAFAFNPNAKQDTFYIHEGNMCQDISIQCSETGDVLCSLKVGAEDIPVWRDLNCSEPAYYNEL